MTLLEKAKAVCRITSDAFDDELTDLISAGFADMGITDIKEELLTNDAPPLIIRALLTYVSMNFKLSNGQVEPQTYDRLKKSYDEQKAQMTMSSDYTNKFEE